MARVTSDFQPWQLDSTSKLENIDAIAPACQQNFNGYSECWAAVVFTDIEGFQGVNYTIRADAGLRYINVAKHTSEVDVRLLPLQWALDSAIVSLRTGNSLSTPDILPFTQETNEDQSRKFRRAYIGGIRVLFVLVLSVRITSLLFSH
jgi:ATP-binding cassette, subfamily A (ABC1), member 3